MVSGKPYILERDQSSARAAHLFAVAYMSLHFFSPPRVRFGFDALSYATIALA